LKEEEEDEKEGGTLEEEEHEKTEEPARSGRSLVQIALLLCIQDTAQL
jgi:hypothetical protein